MTSCSIMGENEVSSSNHEDAESARSGSKNGMSVLPCVVNCTLKLESQNVEYLQNIVFNNEDVKKIKELILTHTKLQSLPNSFSQNLGNLLHLNLEENKLDQLPPNMSNLLKLQHLNLSHNCLKSLSQDIGMITTLKTLRLENNKLSELPGNFCYLINLQQLCVADNNLRYLPTDIGRLVNLEKLDVSGNKIEDLPDSVSQLTNLTSFNAASNKLSYLSEGFTLLNKLTVLNLSHNMMYEVPYCLFTGLPNVSMLDLSHNYIDNFSQTPNCVNKLRCLRLDHNTLFSIPKWLFRDSCKHILELTVSHNRYMSGTNNEIFISASTLKKLDLSNCSLTTTSVNFLQVLQNLEHLNLGNEIDTISKQSSKSGNVFWDLPMRELKNSNNLRNLIMCQVGLATLPEDFVQLSALQYLDLCFNNLNWLPDSFCDLMNLKECHLSNNELALLPVQMGKLKNLEVLSMDENKLHFLPESMTRLQLLKYLDLYSNIFEEVPVILKDMTSLEGLDLEYNCFNVLDSLKNDNFLETYIHMKVNIRSRLAGKSQTRIDSKRPLEVENVHPSPDEGNSSDCAETDSIPQETFYVSREEEEENWDSADEFNDNFDPTLLPIPSEKKVRQRHALLVMESLWTSPDNFCPADIHVPPVKTWCRPKVIPAVSCQSVEGQFDDASLP
ncbi:leucine-rich repeat protein SHOC-2-like isoform X2 [Periplaneta americana]|uniref:leucine-rich repeat protein SHOC-2-like isoform X2 n=1 Tax=Periplaneta americana TaxID=6978 RepID=UPI0037E7775A